MGRAAIVWTSACAAALLASCTADGPHGGGGGLLDRLAGPGRVEGGREAVTVRGMSSAADAFPFAIGHCSHYQRSAQFARRAGDDFVFRCVPKG